MAMCLRVLIFIKTNYTYNKHSQTQRVTSRKSLYYTCLFTDFIIEIPLI